MEHTDLKEIVSLLHLYIDLDKAKNKTNITIFQNAFKLNQNSLIWVHKLLKNIKQTRRADDRNYGWRAKGYVIFYHFDSFLLLDVLEF